MNNKIELQNCYKQTKLQGILNPVELLKCIDIISTEDTEINYNIYKQQLSILISNRVMFDPTLYLTLIWQHLLKQGIQTVEIINKHGQLINIFYDETNI